MEFLQWLSEVGTNEWVRNFISNNNIILTALSGGGFLGLRKFLNRGKNDDQGTM